MDDSPATDIEITYTLPQIAKKLHMGYRTLHNWRQRGLFSPSISENEGSGNTSFYSEQDLVRIAWIANLYHHGIRFPALAMACEDPDSMIRLLKERAGLDADA